MMGWYGNGGWSAGTWVGMGLGMLLFWGLVVVAVIALWHALGRARSGPAGPSTQAFGPGGSAPEARASHALEILDERLARGEVSEEDYRRTRDVLIGR